MRDWPSLQGSPRGAAQGKGTGHGEPVLGDTQCLLGTPHACLCRLLLCKQSTAWADRVFVHAHPSSVALCGRRSGTWCWAGPKGLCPPLCHRGGDCLGQMAGERAVPVFLERQARP